VGRGAAQPSAVSTIEFAVLLSCCVSVSQPASEARQLPEVPTPKIRAAEYDDGAWQWATACERLCTL
jgi:hypothetical protein